MIHKNALCYTTEKISLTQHCGRKCMAKCSICSERLQFFAFFIASFVDIAVLTSQIESVCVTNRVRKSRIESYFHDENPLRVRHRGTVMNKPRLLRKKFRSMSGSFKSSLGLTCIVCPSVTTFFIYNLRNFRL